MLHSSFWKATDTLLAPCDSGRSPRVGTSIKPTLQKVPRQGINIPIGFLFLNFLSVAPAWDSRSEMIHHYVQNSLSGHEANSSTEPTIQADKPCQVKEARLLIRQERQDCQVPSPPAVAHVFFLLPKLAPTYFCPLNILRLSQTFAFIFSDTHGWTSPLLAPSILLGRNRWTNEWTLELEWTIHSLIL